VLSERIGGEGSEVSVRDERIEKGVQCGCVLQTDFRVSIIEHLTWSLATAAMPLDVWKVYDLPESRKNIGAMPLILGTDHFQSFRCR
jgi:hypothetical protein